MIKVGDKIGLTFTFAKTVTAMDDITWEEQTVTAASNSLFVYPTDFRDLTNFWKEVDKWKGEDQKLENS